MENVIDIQQWLKLHPTAVHGRPPMHMESLFTQAFRVWDGLHLIQCIVQKRDGTWVPFSYT